MASDRLGKLKSRKDRDAGKPYERPKSLLGRVSATLRDLLTPSWVRQAPVDDLPTVEEEDDMVTYQEATGETLRNVQVPVQVGLDYSNCVKSSVQSTDEGITVECGGYSATFDHSILGDQQSTFAERSPVARPPLSSMSAYAQPPSEPHSSTSCGSTGLLPTNNNSVSGKRSAPMSSCDDLSTGARDINYREAGTPSKKRRVERNNTRTSLVDNLEKGMPSPRISKGEQSYLWSTKLNSPAVATPGSTSLRVTSTTGKRPGFDLDTFSSTVHHSQSQSSEAPTFLNSSHRESPYYQGKTTYGGASARSRRANPRDADYQVMSTVQQQVMIKPTSAASSQVPLSATARVILQGLEKSDSRLPVQQTITYFQSSQVDSPLSFTPSTYKRHSLQGPGNQLASVKTGPPVHELATPTVAIIQQNIQAYKSSSKDLPEATSTTRIQGNVSSSTSYDLPAVPTSSQAPGKTRRENTRKHYSSKACERMEEDAVPNIDLPNIRLPVTTNLMPFAMMGDRQSEQPASTFTFSLPISAGNGGGTATNAKPKNFQFRSPIAVDDRISRASEITSFSQTSDTAKHQPPPKSSLAFSFNVDAARKKPQPTSVETPSFGLSPASQLKKGSVTDILGSSGSKALAVTSSRSDPMVIDDETDDNKKPLSELFKSAADKWSCSDCMVPNNASVVNCVCCGKSKAVPNLPTVQQKPPTLLVPPGLMSSGKPLSELFKPSADKWSCPDCFVSNPSSSAECPCCGAKNPSAASSGKQSAAASAKPKETTESNKTGEIPKTSSLPSLSSLFQKAPGDWTCPTCSVSNKADKVKCVACEEPKPGATGAAANGSEPKPANTTTNANAFSGQGFKFGSSGTDLGGSQSGFKAPSDTSTVSIAPTGGFQINVPTGNFTGFGSGGFKPSPAVSTSGGFKPDSTVSTSGGFKPAGGFKPFGDQGSGVSFGSNGQNGKVGNAFSETSGKQTEKTGSDAASTESNGHGGFSFKSDSSAKLESSAKTSSDGNMFGSGGFKFGETTPSTKGVIDSSSVSMRPPLRPTETDKTGVRFGAASNVTSENDKPLPNILGSSPVGVKTDAPAAVTSATPFSFGNSQVAFGVAGTSAPQFGSQNTKTESVGAKITFGSSAGPAPPTGGFSLGSTTVTSAQPQFASTAPLGTSFAPASAPAVASTGSLFTQPAASAALPSNLFTFGQSQSNAAPSFKFEQGPTGKEDIKTADPQFKFNQSASGQLNNTSATVNNMPTLNFGQTSKENRPSSSTIAPSFNFGQTTSVQDGGASATGNAPGFKFGQATSTQNEVKSSVGIAPTFKFGQTASGQDEAKSAVGATPVFKFGQAMSGQDETKPAVGGTPVFKFGQTTSGQNESKPAASVPGSLFTFGQNQSVQEPAKPAASGGFAFGQSQNLNTNNPFQFGAPSNTAAPVVGNFGAPAVQPTANPAFGQPPTATTVVGNFGSSTPSNPGLFAFGSKQPDAAAKAGNAPSFIAFGKRPIVEDDVAVKRSRSNTEDMPMQDVESLPTPKQSSIGFSFNPTQTGFGFNATQPSTGNPGFFGANQTNPAPMFGMPLASSAAPAPVPSFNFAGQTSSVPPAFGSQNAPNMVNGAVNTGQPFGAAPSNPAGFNFSSTPTFNFSGAPTNQPTSVTFSAQPPAAGIPGRAFKRGIRRTGTQRHN